MDSILEAKLCDFEILFGVLNPMLPIRYEADTGATDYAQLKRVYRYLDMLTV